MLAAGCLIVWLITMCLLLRLHMSSRIAIATVRATLQLTALGFVLGEILTTDEPFFVLPYIVLMMLIAWREAAVKPANNYAAMAAHLLVSLTCALTLSFALTAAVVLQPSPWYQGRYMIPVCGMLLGSCVNVLSLGMDRFLASIEQGSAHVLALLAAGASRREAALPSLRVAMTTGLTPNLNQLSVMGLVSIPGMMTGTVLAGTPPLIAAKYQLLIMFLICFTSTNALATALLLATTRALFDAQHRLLVHAIRKRPKGKPPDALLALLQLLAAPLLAATRRLRQSTRAGSETPSPPPATEAAAASATRDAGSAEPVVAAAPCDAHLSRRDGATEQSDPILRLRGGAVAAALGGPPLVRGVELALYTGEHLAVTGPSGCGKSTLLRCLAQLNPLSAGTLELNGQPSGAISATSWRTRVCYVAQAGVGSLPGTPRELAHELAQLDAQRDRLRATGSGEDDAWTAEDVHLEPGAHGAASGAQVVERRLEGHAKQLGLATKLLSQSWSKLSGGEAQRIYLSLALALRPTVLLLDEPTSACDAEAALAVERLVAQSAAGAVVWVTHDPAQAERVAQATLELSRPDDEEAVGAQLQVKKEARDEGGTKLY